MYCTWVDIDLNTRSSDPVSDLATLCDAVFKLFRRCTLPACYFILLKLDWRGHFQFCLYDFSLLKALRRKRNEYYRMGLTRITKRSKGLIRWRFSARAGWNFSLRWKSSKQPSNMFLIRSRLHGYFQPGSPEWNSSLLDRWISLKTALEIHTRRVNSVVFFFSQDFIVIIQAEISGAVHTFKIDLRWI